jgi:hypothetical protein
MRPFPSHQEVKAQVSLYNGRYGRMDVALWNLALQARSSLLAGSSVDAEVLAWTLVHWWGIQGLDERFRRIAGRALLNLGLAEQMFVDSFPADDNACGAVTLVLQLLDTFRRHGHPRREISLSSKVLHWLLPWRIAPYDSYVRKALDLSEGDPKAVLASIEEWHYQAAMHLLSSDVPWRGEIPPDSPLRALDKYLWMIGGGSIGSARVEPDPESFIKRVRLRVLGEREHRPS